MNIHRFPILGHLLDGSENSDFVQRILLLLFCQPLNLDLIHNNSHNR